MARVLATATPLPKGEVLGAGGGPNVSSNCLATAELFNPATGQWTTTGRMTTPHCNHSATLRANGQVLVAGGGNSTGFNSLNIAELFNPATGTWQATGSLAAIDRFPEAIALSGQAKPLLRSGAMRTSPMRAFATRPTIMAHIRIVTATANSRETHFPSQGSNLRYAPLC